MVVILTVIFYAICSAVSIYLCRREGLLSTGNIFVISSSLYYVAIPAELFILKEEVYHKGGLFISINHNEMALVILLASVAVLSFIAGYKSSGYNLKPEAFYSNEARALFRKPSSVWLAYRLLTFGSLACLIVCFDEELFNSIKSYEYNVRTVYLTPSFSFVKVTFSAATSACALSYLCIQKKVRRGLGLVVVLFAFGVATSDKNPIVAAFLPFVCWVTMLSKKKRLFPLGAIFVGLFGVLVLMIFLPTFSLYRAGINIFSRELFDSYYFSFSRIDPGGPFVSLSEAVRNTSPLLLGKTYIENFAMLIPKMFWPERPVDLAETFAREILPLWRPGQGLGYSLLAEALINFGYFGAFLQYFVLGFTWGLFWRSITIFTKSAVYTNVLYRTLGFYLLILMHRGPSLQLIKTLTHFVAPLLLVLVISQVVVRSGEPVRSCENVDPDENTSVV